MKTALIGFVPLICLSSICQAEPDQCNDVLRDGTFNYANYRSNSYYLQIVYSRFLSSTYENSKTDTSLGMGIPIGEAVMGSLNYSKDEYEAKKLSIDQTKFRIVERRNETQVMLSSGDQNVLDAWTECIRKAGGGLSVRFEPLSATQARIVIEYRKQGTQYTAKLSADVATPGIDRSSLSNPECFKKNRVIYDGSPCISTVTLPDAWTPLALSVNSYQGSAGAYHPQRIRLVEKRESAFTGEVYGEYFRRGNVRESRTFTLTPEEQRAGWLLDPVTARHSVSKVFDNGRNNNSCYGSFATVSPYSAEYGYNVISHTRGHGGWTVGCSGRYYIEKYRQIWEADQALREVPKAVS